jgi:hypothetical protein
MRESEYVTIDDVDYDTSRDWKKCVIFLALPVLTLLGIFIFSICVR